MTLPTDSAPLYPIDASLTMAEASRIWFEQHKRDLKPNTIRCYECALKVLRPFFGSMILSEIRIPDIRRYLEERSAKAGPYLINAEVVILQAILKQAGRWKDLAELYKPLRVPKRRAGHSLSAEEEQHLRDVAFSQPKWQLAGHCMMIMLSTTMGFGELRQLRRKDVDIQRRCVLVREGAKNEHRERTIPLNASAYESMTWILDRWKGLGGSSDEHYILPHRPRSNKAPWILDEPMTAITTAFHKIRKAAGLPKFRVYDCRVQAITKLLSNPAVSSQVSKEIAGHISQAMQDRYSIQQFDTKKAALDALENPATAPEEVLGPPVPAQPAVDIMHPAIQAEIARQVALALQQRFAMPAVPATQEHTPVHSQRATPGVIAFPGPRFTQGGGR